MSPGNWIAIALCAGSVACGSSPPSAFYALSPESGTAQPSAVRTLKLRRPGIAAYLDRPEIVKVVADHRLGIADTDRWAGPLDEMLGRILAQDVEQRLAGSVVFTEDGAITADAEVTIEVDVRRFDVGEAGDVNLVAEVALERGDTHAPIGMRAVILRQSPSGLTTAALVSAMSDLLGKLADQIAVLVRAGSSTPTVSADAGVALSPRR